MKILDCEIKVMELIPPLGHKNYRAIAFEFCVDGKWLEPQLSINEVLAATENEAKKLMEINLRDLAKENGYLYRF
ncbi:hypothetical protein [Vibrio parahaemolyticus]|uniref:hypothetical protein n=1 Tax=Vibrio parahaemolyticus TaxID=670 RepID=UPI00111D05F9|nr:hypothetical protein [Vibrio parahaemolyticus]TOL88575.1 hypothetical protein CGH88_23155 [Vibrio parahaemolyticus]